MSHRTLVAVAACLGLAVSAYWAGRRGSQPEPAFRGESVDQTVKQIPNGGPEIAVSPDSSNAPPERAAGEVRAMPQTLRNSTFLIAIRRAGYYCDDVVSATESAEGGWVASCADKGGYTLSVRATDRFEVRPIEHFWDGIQPIPVRREFEPR